MRRSRAIEQVTIRERAQQLLAARTPFVHATVVRAAPPASAYPGDEAILLADGTIEGFVGGQCAQNSVRKAALGVLQAGESVLLRVLPDGDVHFPEAPGACVVVNPCLSGGSLEIFLTPQLPAPRGPRLRVHTDRRRADPVVCGAGLRRAARNRPVRHRRGGDREPRRPGSRNHPRGTWITGSGTSAWWPARFAARRSSTNSNCPTPSEPAYTPRSDCRSAPRRPPRSRCPSRPN